MDSVFSSITTCPTAAGSRLAVTMPPTACSLSPAAAALARSTVTAMYGCVSERLLVACSMDGMSLTAARTASADVLRSSESLAVISTVMSLEEKPPDAAASDTSPTSVRPSTAVRTRSRMASWSASASVVSANVIPPPPPNAEVSEVLSEPIEVCTVSTPWTPMSACSTFVAAVSCASRLVSLGSSCETVSVFWPLSPRKLVFMLGMSATVPPSTRIARISVTAECLSVQARIGR